MIFWITLQMIVLLSMWGFVPCRAANSDIIINEIAAYQVSGHEWVELYNRGSTPVDLTGWKFVESGGAHALKTMNGSAIIEAYRYGVIAQSSTQFLGDNPSVTATLFGAQSGGSTWSTLVEGGEVVGLVDASGVTLESFTYVSAPNASLERKNPNLNDYTTANWQQRASGNSVGQPNSVLISNQSEAGGSVVTSTGNTTPAEQGGFSELRINEIMPSPTAGSEWVELYNSGDRPVLLTGLTLCDNRTSASCTIAEPTSTIEAYGFTVIYVGTGKLNNDGDTVILKNIDGAVIDQVVYQGLLIPINAESLARSQDGSGAWARTTRPTPGSANIIVSPQTTISSSASTVSEHDPIDEESELGVLGSTGVSQSFGIVWYATTTAQVVIAEVLPNPTGDDVKSEFIELWNTSDQDIDITGWRLWVDGASYRLSGFIEPDERKTWYRSTTKLDLKNSTSSEVRLMNGDQAILDSVRYVVPILSGQSFSRDSEGGWSWTKPTPQQKNSFIDRKNDEMLWRCQIPHSVAPHETVWFRSGQTRDPRGGELEFEWRIGTTSLRGTEVAHVFATSGRFEITLIARSSQGTMSRTSTFVMVDPAAQPETGIVRISEVMPRAAQNNEEFIELYNADSRPVSLAGWQLHTKIGKPFVIPEKTIIGVGKTLVFYKSITALSPSSNDVLQLYDSRAVLVDQVVLPSVKSGWSYQVSMGRWVPTAFSSPGRIVDGVQIVETKKLTQKSTPSTTVSSASKKKSSTKKISLQTVQRPTLSEFWHLPKGTRVEVEGSVVAEPGVFGSQYAVVATEDAGILLYQYQKKFPDITYGDLVRVRGTVSETSGRKRLTIAQDNAIDVVATGHPLEPSDIQIGDITAEYAGTLVRIRGELTSKAASRGFIDDGTDEISFVIKTGTKLSTKNWRVGSQVSLTGVIMPHAQGFEIWPRRIEDVVFELSAENEEKHPTAAGMGSQSGNLNQIIALGLALVGAGVGWRWWRLSRVGSKT